MPVPRDELRERLLAENLLSAPTKAASGHEVGDRL